MVIFYQSCLIVKTYCREGRRNFYKIRIKTQSRVFNFWRGEVANYIVTVLVVESIENIVNILLDQYIVNKNSVHEIQVLLHLFFLRLLMALLISNCIIKQSDCLDQFQYCFMPNFETGNFIIPVNGQ